MPLVTLHEYAPGMFEWDGPGIRIEVLQDHNGVRVIVLLGGVEVGLLARPRR